MTRIEKSSLSVANSGEIITKSEEASEAFLSVASSINDFVSNSQTELVGNGFDSIRNVLSFYSDALTKASELVLTFENAIKTNNNSMAVYMDFASVLDTADLRKISDLLNHLYALLRYIESIPAEKFNNICNKDRLIAETKAKIDYFERLKAKIEGMPKKDGTLFSFLMNSLNRIRNFSNMIDSIPNDLYWYRAGLNKLVRDNYSEEKEAILISLMNEIDDPQTLELMMAAFGLLGYIEGTKKTKVVYSQARRNTTNKDGQRYLDCSSFVTYLYNQVYNADIPVNANTGTMNKGYISLLKLVEGKNNVGGKLFILKFDEETGTASLGKYNSNGELKYEDIDVYKYDAPDGETYYCSPDVPYINGAPASNFRYEYPYEVLEDGEEPQPGDLYITKNKGHVRLYLGSVGGDSYYIECHDNSNGVEVVKMDENNNSTIISHKDTTDSTNVGKMDKDSYYLRYNGNTMVCVSENGEKIELEKE